MPCELKRPYQIYLTPNEVKGLKEESEQLSKVLKKKVGVSKLIRLKLRLNGEMEELKKGIETIINQIDEVKNCLKDYRTSIVNSIIKARQPRPATVANYVTAPQYSRSKDGSLRIQANFSFLQYVRDQSALSHLFDNNAGLLSTADLLDIKVYRKRVDTTNYGNFLTSVQRHEDQSISSRATKRLVGTLSDGSVRPIQSNSQDLMLEILPILIIDNQIKDESEGYYHYEIEVTINDNSAKIVSEMARKLQDKITEAQSYNLKFNNYGKRNYDVDTNTQAHEAELKSDSSWRSALEEYISILQLLYKLYLSSISY